MHILGMLCVHLDSYCLPEVLGYSEIVIDSCMRCILVYVDTIQKYLPITRPLLVI